MSVPVLVVDPDRPDPGALDQAATALQAGGVIGLPTDTVYGLAADPTRPGATDRIFAVKHRPSTVVLPLLVAGAEQAAELTVPTPAALKLMRRWWPGPLTIVMATAPECHLPLGGDGTTVGLRCPDHAVPRRLCQLVGPLAMTSANRHGDRPATKARDVADALSGVALVLDAGRCDGVPSTVVDCSAPEPRLVRPGGVTWVDIVACIEDRDPGAAPSPGPPAAHL